MSNNVEQCRTIYGKKISRNMPLAHVMATVGPHTSARAAHTAMGKSASCIKLSLVACQTENCHANNWQKKCGQMHSKATIEPGRFPERQLSNVEQLKDLEYHLPTAECFTCCVPGPLKQSAELCFKFKTCSLFVSIVLSKHRKAIFQVSTSPGENLR